MRHVLVVFFVLVSCKALFGQSTTLHEPFSTCISNLPLGWQKYSVAGSDAWACTSAGQSGRGVQMSGYSGGSNHDNEDWLVSPQLDLSAYSDPKLSFWCRTKYTGPFIQVFVSTNYSGTGNPAGASWTNLSPILPTTNSDVWFLSDNISLQAYKNQPLYLAFKYTSTSIAAATWKIDEVNVSDGSFSIPDRLLNVGQSAVGIPSPGKPFTFTMSGSVTSFSASVTPPFQLSTDGINYTGQLNFPASIAGNPQTVYVRFIPGMANHVWREAITFLLNGNMLSENVRVIGTSLADQKTLRVLTWNMRWFGDPGNCSCDTNEARLNAIDVMKDADADLYCLQEVVAVDKISSIAAALGSKYQSTVSPFCSFATSTSASNYPGGQKLAFIYNTEKIESMGTFGLLASTYPGDTSSNSGYYCFSSGRFPFVLKAKLKLDAGILDTLIIANLHAKAISDVASYNRRVCATEKMTDSLNALFPGKRVLVIGDFNDYLEGSQVSSMSVSPYKYLLDHGFTGITLPSKYPGESTYVGSMNAILDNVVASNSLLPAYPDSTCFIMHEVEQAIANYNTSTSDHIPVMCYFQFNFSSVLGLNQSEKHAASYTIVNPSDHHLRLRFLQENTTPCELTLSDFSGRCLARKKIALGQSEYAIDFPQLNDGLYLLTIQQDGERTTLKWMVSNP